MLLSYERQFGEAVRQRRVVQFGCGTREEFCHKYQQMLGGMKPEILHDMEKGDLLGQFNIEHMVSMINFLWANESVRISMLNLAYKVEARMLDAHESGQHNVTTPLVVQKDRRLPHRERI